MSRRIVIESEEDNVQRLGFLHRNMPCICPYLPYGETYLDVPVPPFHNKTKIFQNIAVPVGSNGELDRLFVRSPLIGMTAVTLAALNMPYYCYAPRFKVYGRSAY